MILFFDTETTGFFKGRLPVDDPSQPYLVQLAAELCDDDGRDFGKFSFIINPELGVIIQNAASSVHGISNEIAARFGISAEFALTAFTHLYQRADLICAHNIEFDKRVMEAAISRRYGKIFLLRKPLFCTMRAATQILNLPPTERMMTAGFNKPKQPKLEECMRHFFNEDHAGAHDAMADVIACRRVYFHLKPLLENTPQ